MALRLHNRKWYPLIFLMGLAAIIAAWRLFQAVPRPELLVPAIGAVGGFTYFFYRQHLDETKLFKELFTEFNRRYDALNDDLNKILFRPCEDPLSDKERECLFKYFNLCAEEYFFYEAGYIDRLVWESWYRGMGVLLRHPHVKTLWEQDCHANSYYDFQPPPEEPLLHDADSQPSPNPLPPPRI